MITLPPESSFKGKLVWQTAHVWPPSAGAPVRMMGGPVEKAQRATGMAPKPSAGSILTIRMRIYSFMTLVKRTHPALVCCFPFDSRALKPLVIVYPKPGGTQVG